MGPVSLLVPAEGSRTTGQCQGEAVRSQLVPSESLRGQRGGPRPDFFSAHLYELHKTQIYILVNVLRHTHNSVWIQGPLMRPWNKHSTGVLNRTR